MPFTRPATQPVAAPQGSLPAGLILPVIGLRRRPRPSWRAPALPPGRCAWRRRAVSNVMPGLSPASTPRFAADASARRQALRCLFTQPASWPIWAGPIGSPVVTAANSAALPVCVAATLAALRTSGAILVPAPYRRTPAERGRTHRSLGAMLGQRREPAPRGHRGTE